MKTCNKYKYSSRLIRFQFLLIILLSHSCIERYYPENYIAEESKIVVDALISDIEENQKIKLSKSNLPNLEEFLPLSNCEVSVLDENGKEFVFEENMKLPGTYEGKIGMEYLTEGTKLRLKFTTEYGEEYTSEFEEFTPCPPVDSIYHELEYKPTEDPSVTVAGYQFYIDFKAPSNYGKYYRMQVDETWEYHSTWPIKDYINENNVYIRNTALDYSLFVCYKTAPVDKIFIINTSGLAENQYIKYSLHFVNDYTQRLLYKYSILIKQYSLSESAFRFWEKLKRNNQESGGIFDSQPVIVKGNITNINNPKELVLGYFGLSSTQTKRIVVSNVKDLSFDNVPYCVATKIDGPLPGERPLYFVKSYDFSSGATVDGYAGADCFDCTLKGGTTVKPDYWDR